MVCEEFRPVELHAGLSFCPVGLVPPLGRASKLALWYIGCMHTDTRKPGHDLSAILDASQENKWVAIAPDYSRVIAAADTLRELMASAPATAILHRVLPHDVSFAPSAF